MSGFPGGMNRGGGNSLPTIGYSGPALTTSNKSADAAGQASISGATGGTWSLTGAGPFTISSTTGALTLTGTPTAQTYTETAKYTWTTGGVTYTAQKALSIVVTTAASIAALKFNLASNSQYITALAA